MIIFNEKHYDNSYGSPFDRGSADSYYSRKRNPHKWKNDGSSSDRYNYSLTKEELEAYHAGYDYNEMNGDKKSWY